MKPIENPDNHDLIARNICEWDWNETYGAWHDEVEFINEPVTPFKRPVNRETAIEAARLKGWYIDIGSLISGYSIQISTADVDEQVDIFPIYDLLFDANQMIYPTRAQAEFAALLWVAQQIQSYDSK